MPYCQNSEDISMNVKIRTFNTWIHTHIIYSKQGSPITFVWESILYHMISHPIFIAIFFYMNLKKVHISKSCEDICTIMMKILNILLEMSNFLYNLWNHYERNQRPFSQEFNKHVLFRKVG